MSKLYTNSDEVANTLTNYMGEPGELRTYCLCTEEAMVDAKRAYSMSNDNDEFGVSLYNAGDIEIDMEDLAEMLSGGVGITLAVRDEYYVTINVRKQ